MKTQNIFTNLPNKKTNEVFKTLLKTKNMKIERIVSLGQCTPGGVWLKEKSNEWVILLKGKAKLRFKKGNRLVTLKRGDYVYIPSGAGHRVEWTSSKEKSVWLAVWG